LLGVIHDEELAEVYMIRARHYDAQHGRFISMDQAGKNLIYNNCLLLSCST